MTMPKPQGTSPDAAGSDGRSKGRAVAAFPRNTLKEALRIAEAIHDKNGGNPMPPIDLAVAIGSSPGSSVFRDILSSSYKYGLTTGAFNQPRVTLTTLGLSIVAPVSSDAKRAALIEAAFSPPIFRLIQDYFRNKKLPESPFFENTISREFPVPKDFAQECAATFTENATFVGLVRTGPTGNWLTESVQSGKIDTHPPAANEPRFGPTEGTPAAELPATGTPAELEPPVPSSRPLKNYIFIGHGKNTKTLDQLRAVLDQYSIPYRIATEDANRGRPISQKVADTMRDCGAAILIFTADEELQRKDGSIVWKPSENVVHELGAASILYDQRIVIFKEEGVELPSNFKDLGYITFPKDELRSKGIDLFRELTALKIIKVSVGE